MVFNNEYDFGDIISIISVFLAFLGVLFGFFQWKKTNKTKRAEYIERLTETLRNDEDINEMIYILDYNHVWYTDKFHDSGKFERQMDKTLLFFSNICYLYSLRLITRKEFAFFEYEIERVFMNFQLKLYFFNLYHYAISQKTTMTFFYLFEYGKKHGKFDEDFYNKNSPKYIEYKYLNF